LVEYFFEVENDKKIDFDDQDIHNFDELNFVDMVEVDKNYEFKV